jgi:hypothetical protein
VLSWHRTPAVVGLPGASPPASSLTAAIQPRPILDFDGDGASDYVVLRPTAGTFMWYTLNSQGLSGVPWGLAGPGDLAGVTPGDYDGDGKWDPAVWRSGASAIFWVRQSGGGVVMQQWGTNNDYPRVVADFDGDDKTDFAVVRATTVRTWYLLQSTAGSTAIVWGLNNDDEAPGDYDGDGKTDLAVRRWLFEPQGVFYINGSTAGFMAIPWGIATDRVVPSDYDGDGKTDIAVVRDVNGTYIWYIRRSTDLGLSVHALGDVASDTVTPADYDGDGKTDVAIWHLSVTLGACGFWVIRSTDGLLAFQPFGQVGDYPAAASLTAH